MNALTALLLALLIAVIYTYDAVVLVLAVGG